MTKHFLTILDLTRDEAFAMVRRADEMKRAGQRLDLLRGKTMVLVFEKASTRTRLSFEVAVRHLGGSTIFMTDRESQLGRSEPLKDTARVISRYADGLIVRTFGQEKLEELVRYASVPVVNALSDQFHPCQVMSDCLTMYERTPDLASLKVAWVGDGNNMAHSFINAAALFGFELRLACPRGFEPDEAVVKRAKGLGARLTLCDDPALAVKDADYVNTDVWASMGQEHEFDDRLRKFGAFQVSEELLALAKPTCKVMHCLPAHRGEELTEAVLEGPASIVWDQAENRLHMQKAILEWIYS
ncbi:Ornithine carbamoyltransferase [Alkalidesulfovibrio alkalitolerans DSM 16529]|jgi:ornithine carbamoyltransferase|uniref:Ornithine carbamoyltransferase n=1 Tax=Alkalidesulfovibrio alkalitolerans DSM 16529 TaxID=1121439 RepID=S7ULP1_9BACT|nr:ornithine carbamoyltransferase [Alkalidesulfovibrio alkalitolerans]EPR34779.1 Ornithine carbamoyltransferase [Alkalidesulfovibrio alkalitolerans DSM 16529]